MSFTYPTWEWLGACPGHYDKVINNWLGLSVVGGSVGEENQSCDSVFWCCSGSPCATHKSLISSFSFLVLKITFGMIYE